MMIICPCCGNRIREKRSTLKKPRTHRRLPNGFGSITEIKGRSLRKPFLVRVCAGKDSNGRPILRSMRPNAYFKTYNDAFCALMEYNRDPYDISENITLKELYDDWIKIAKINKTDNYERIQRSLFEFIHDYHNVEIQKIRTKDIKKSIETAYIIEKRGPNKGNPCYAGNTTKKRIKELWNMLFDYAVEYEMVNKNYARTFKISAEIKAEIENNKRAHLPFSPNELERLWSNTELPGVDMILIQCYTGWRPGELCTMKTKHVNLDNWSMIGGNKTKNGKNRNIPIHTAIRSLVKSRYDKATRDNLPYLFSATKSKENAMAYGTYKYIFKNIIKKLELDPNHRPHDPRKTFITEAKRAGVSDNAIKVIVGHAITDITESVYTDRDLEWLRQDIEKIPVYK